jgi:hypothetical protein
MTYSFCFLSFPFTMSPSIKSLFRCILGKSLVINLSRPWHLYTRRISCKSFLAVSANFHVGAKTWSWLHEDCVKGINCCCLLITWSSRKLVIRSLFKINMNKRRSMKMDSNNNRQNSSLSWNSCEQKNLSMRSNCPSTCSSSGTKKPTAEKLYSSAKMRNDLLTLAINVQYIKSAHKSIYEQRIVHNIS